MFLITTYISCFTGAACQPRASAALPTAEEGDRPCDYVAVRRRCLCRLQHSASGNKCPGELL